MQRFSELSRLRCSACGARAEFPSLYSARGVAPERCGQCGSRPAAVVEAWGALANPCTICQLPVFEILHDIWPGAGEDAWRSEDAPFGHGVHAARALRLGVRR